MFGIGPMELIVVGVVAVIFIGPKRLPEVMKKLGRTFVQLRRQTHEIRQGINDVVRDAERDLELERIKDIKAEVDKLRNINLEQKLKEQIDIDPNDLKIDGTEPKSEKLYNDAHYQDGEYVHHDDGFVNVDDLLEKAKEIEDKVLRGVKDKNEDNSGNNVEPEDHNKKALEDTDTQVSAHDEALKEDKAPKPDSPS